MIPLRLPLVVSLLSLLNACSFGGEVPANAQVICKNAHECPAGYECIASVGYCVRTGSELPSVEVTFTLPRDGDQGVSLTSSAVVVFNLETAVPPPNVISLISENGADVVPLVLSSTNSANTLLVEPQRLLFPLTRYVLTVGAGVPPVAGEIAVASRNTWVATFETADSTDDEPPLPVTAMLTSFDSVSSIYTFKWTTSASADEAGVVVLASGTGPIHDGPVIGTSYAVGEMIGDARVVYVGVGPGGTDKPPSFVASQRYAAFAYDTALNYSIGIGAPPATLTDAIYCPDKMGMFHLSSLDPAMGQAAIGTADSTPVGASRLVPDAPVTFPVNVPITPGNPFVEGTVVFARPLTTAGDARFLGASTRIVIGADVTVTASATLSTTIPTANVGGNWGGYAAEVDNNPTPGVENWIEALGGAVTISAKTALPNGSYRFRARPLVPGCATPPWTVSNEFSVGDNTVLYVVAGATGSGLSVTDAMGSVAAAVSKVAIAGTINVAAGSYTDILSIAKNVKLLGGWNNTFTARDPVTSLTTITSPMNTLYIDGPVDASAQIDGFKFVASGTGALLATINSGSPSLSNNRFEAPRPLVVSGGSPQFLNNTFAGTSSSSATVVCSAGQPRFEGNTISNEPGSAASGVSFALDVGVSCNVTAIANRIEPASVGGASLTCTAVHLTFGGGTFINNLVAGGPCGASYGMWLDSPAAAPSGGTLAPVIVSNNTVLADTKGFYLDATRGAAALWNVHMTNNFVVSGAVNFPGFEIHSSFAPSLTLQNNWVGALGSTSPNFACIGSTSFNRVCYMSSVDSSLCTKGLVASGNKLGNGNVFLDVNGADRNKYTLADDNLKIDSSISAADNIRNGGLLLSGGNNCGGASCTETATPNASCGIVDKDFVGVLRTAPYAIGAYEVD